MELYGPNPGRFFLAAHSKKETLRSEPGISLAVLYPNETLTIRDTDEGIDILQNNGFSSKFDGCLRPGALYVLQYRNRVKIHGSSIVVGGFCNSKNTGILLIMKNYTRYVCIFNQ